MTPEQLQERETRLRKAFIDQDFGEAGASLDESAFAGVEDRKRLLMSSAVAGWAGSMMGQRVNPASPDWQGIKDGIARGYFKNREASNVADEELFLQIAEDYKAKDALAEAARNAAARGESWLGKFREIEQTMPNVAGGRQVPFLGLAKETHDKFREKILPYQGAIRSVAEKAKSIETSPEGMDWSGMAQELIQVPKESRPFVLEAISRQAAANIDADAASRLGKEFARGFERFLDTAMSGAESVGESGPGRFLRQSYGFDVDALTPEQQEQRAQFMDLRDDIRDISTGKLAKLEDVRVLGMNISGAARNVPMTIGAFVPYIGPAALVGSFQRETANELRRANPTMSRDDIETIATISAPFQAVTEVVSDRLLFGKLPNLKRLFTTPAFSAGGIAAQLAGRAALGTATEYAEEFAQGVIPKLVQSLKSDVPDVDWDGYFQDFKDQSPELLATILPLALFGAGVGQATDYRASVQMLYSADEMMAAKIPADEARKIAELATAGKRPEAESMFRQEFRKAATKGEAPAEMRAAAQRVIAVNQAQKQTFEDALTDPAKMGATMYRDAEGWKVETYSGSVFKVDSAEAAVRYINDLHLSFEEYEAETMIALSDDLVQAFPGTKLELSPSRLSADKQNGLVLYNPVSDKTTVIKDAKSLENLWNEASAIGFNSGNKPQYALGQNFMEFGQSIARVFRSDGRQNSAPQAITAMHEVIEAAWKKGVMQGDWSVESTRQMISTLVPTLEAGIAKLGKKAQAQELLWLDNAKKVMTEGNEDLVREVFVEMAVRTWIGRDRDGNKTGLRPGTILRALDAAILQEKSPENVTTYQRLRAWFKAVGAYLKGVVATAKIIRDAERNGTIDDFTGFLDKVLGIEAATREESEVKQDVQNMAFSLAPELRSSSQGYLGAVSEDGEVKIKSADLATDTHESSNLDPRNDGVGTFRYRKDNETLYWHFAPSEIRKESAIAALERKGFKVAKSKVISFGSEDSLIAHGLDRALVKGSTFSLAPTEQDREYLAAVEAGDMAKAQAMVDAAAKAAGYDHRRFHGYTKARQQDRAPTGTYPPTVLSESNEPGRIFTTSNEVFAEVFGGKSFPTDAGWRKFNTEPLTRSDVTPADYKIEGGVLNLFVKMLNPIVVKDIEARHKLPNVKTLKEQGYDSIEVTGIESVLFSPNQIKSANPVTRDESGQVIPLSHRFNPETPDIRFSLSPQSGIDIVSDTLESWQEVFDKAAKRNPARAMAIRDLAQQRINRLGEMWAADRWTAKGDKIRAVVEKRTKGSLDDEQAMREALRYQELLDAGMDTLTPDTLMAYSEGVGTLEDDPLVKKMLHENGRLMSWATASRQNRDIKDQYNDAPWIPPQWYAKGDGGIMPDVMANNLGFDKASEMWAALESSIKSHRNAKEGYAKAEAAVKAVEKQAREQSKAEAAEWRQEADDMQADDWSPRESLVRDMRVLNVALSAFPPEVRAKVTGGSMVKLAGLATERARYKAIKKALEKAIVETEVFMRKEYTEQVDEALDTYRSQKDSGGRISGKLPSQYTELVDYAYRIREASIEDQATESGGLEKALEESESDQQTQGVLTKMGILRLFEAWDMKDSTAMAAASEWLSDTIESGKLGRKLLDEDRKAMLDDFRATAKKDAVPEGKISKVDVDNETNNVRFKVFRRAWQGLNGAFDSAVHTFGERLSLVFGDDSKITDHFSMSMIQAANASNDIKREVNRKYHDMLSVVFNSRSRLAHARAIGQMQKVKASGIMITEGRVVEETKLDIETLTKLADGAMTAEAAGLRQDQVDDALEEFAANSRKRTVTVETVKNAGEQKERQMTELQGLQWWLWSRQDASRKQMERDGWTGESFAQLDAFLSPEAKALGEWIAKGYDDAARLIDPVYRRLFRAPLPRVKNYAPIYRNRSGDASVMDLDASDISSGLAAGFTKSRVNTVSPLAEMDAVTVMLTHWENVAHWVTHAEAVRDAKAVLLDRDVMTAIKQSSGNVSANSIKQRVAAIESQGTNAARELVDLSRMWRWIMQYRAFKGLAFRMSPVIKQTPALLNPLLADVPAHSYTTGLARAFYDPAAFGRDVAEMFKSDTIMRRIEGGFSAEARIAMQGEGAVGSVALAWMQRGMMPMSWTDGGWTALGAAVSYDYYKRGYMSENPKASMEMADAYATRKLEKMIATSAQPSDIVNRSLIEASSNPFMRSLWMFASDQRKALGIEVTALKKLFSGKSKNKAMDVQRILVAHFAQAAMSQLMASWMASLVGDDDDKEREWSREQWTISLALGPVNGLFVFGRLIDMAGRGLINSKIYQENFGTGQKLRIFPGGNLVEKAADDLIRGGKSMDELFNPDDPEDFINALDALSVGASGVMTLGIGPQAGVVDVTANLVREGNKIIKAATED